MERPDKTMYFLNIALSVATRSTCLRRKFGAVIVKDNTIVGTGYNGNARGVVNCHEAGCIKNLMDSPKGQAYDYCPAVHAEENAIINSNRADRIDATLYIAGLDADGRHTMALPCQRCQRKIINSQIKEVVILRDDGTPKTIDVAEYVEGDTRWYKKLLDEARSEASTNL
ncbi:MAG TPA: dCMP deaminase family protein [Candidatus Bathyarchaeia archaeon]